MNSLTSKTLNLAFLLFTYACSVSAEQASVVCVEKVLAVKVVKIDEASKRFFVAGKDVEAKNISANMLELHACFATGPWHKKWSMSLFSEKKYVGYKDDDSIIQYHSDNGWAKAYKAEYDSESNSLVGYPALSPVQILP